jgi:2-polyprenyl-3-methyl-5-hydroxy-6-metoxy-1,4-benzoquinol methylase
MGGITEPAFGRWWIERTAEGHGLDRTAHELGFVLEQLQLTPNARILDVGCSRGRHSLWLAARGYQVTGLDPEAEAIAVARESASTAGLAVTFLCADMAEADLHGFDAAICIGTSLGFHETDAGDQQQLNAIARALVPGGRFFLEITALFAQEYGEGIRRTWQRQGDILVFDEGRFDALTCRAHHITTYLRGSEERRREERYRVYAAPEMTKMLAVAGFELEHTFGDCDGSPFGLRSPSFIAVCRRGT